jgi:hypothetical protein
LRKGSHRYIFDFELQGAGGYLDIGDLAYLLAEEAFTDR